MVSTIIEVLLFIGTIISVCCYYSNRISVLETKHDHLKADTDKVYEMFNRKQELFEQRLEEEARSSDSAIQTVISQLNALTVTMTEVKTEVKLMREQKNNK